MNSYSAHVDHFVRDRLPPREQWPEFLFDAPTLQCPARINCARLLIDDAVLEGHGARTAIYADTASVTYGSLLEQANRIANVLVDELGVVPGNRVLLRSSNNPTLVAAWLAVMKVGAVAVTTMPMLRDKELAAIAEHAQIDHAIADHRLLAELELAAQKTGRLRNIVTFGGSGDLDARMSRQSASFTTVETSREDPCILAFTSGTTGVPKATIHFHRDVLAVTEVLGRHLLHTSAEDVYLGSPPIGFTFGLGALVLLPLRFRGAAALVERPTPESLHAMAQRARATCLFTAPTMYRSLLPLVSAEPLKSLRRCVSAGEPLARATAEAWRQSTGVRLIDGIGSTEMLHIFISAAGEEIRPGATGKPLPGYQACVVGENGIPLPPGSTGRLAVKGPTGCRYLSDPRQREYVVGGWNITGDRYRVDEDGYFWFVSRDDDMIISAGYNIAGPEVEAALLEHAAVKECAVVASPDSERGQIAKAFVVVREAHEPSAALASELQEFVKSHIAPYKYPRMIEFVESLPKTQTGKVQRFVLRQREAEA